MAQGVIAGRYELQQLLGRGGMGEGWAAHDGVMQRSVAVKLLQPHLGTAEGEELFFREARTAGALSHPGIVTVHDLGRDGDGTLYLVMENVPGRNLGIVLQDGLPPSRTSWRGPRRPPPRCTPRTASGSCTVT